MSSRINIIIPCGLSLLLRITGEESVWWGTEAICHNAFIVLLSCSATFTECSGSVAFPLAVQHQGILISFPRRFWQN